jgi:hypothetical protein
MKISKEILDILKEEENKKLLQLYNTDLFNAYLKKLKDKYYKLYTYLEDIEKNNYDTKN